VTSNAVDRYSFRTSPLRNVALQPAFMHNGAFVRLEDAVRYHLDAVSGSATYGTGALPPDLRGPTGPLQPLLDALDPALRSPVRLTNVESRHLWHSCATGFSTQRRDQNGSAG
jgi:cytochrome c peroxidase